MFAAVGLVVVIVAGMATGSWVVFGIALAAHLIASAIVLKGAFKGVGEGGQADRRSEQLDERAGDAVGDGPRNVESEIEALKREPASRS